VILSLLSLEGGAVLVRDDEETPISERTPALWWLELLPLPLLEDRAALVSRAEEGTICEVGGLCAA